VAESVRPNPDALTNVDRPEPPDQFETAGGRQVGLNERPVAGLNVSSSNAAVCHQSHEGTEVEYEGEVLPATEPTDEARNPLYDARGRVQDAVVTEAGGTAGYVLRFDRSEYIFIELIET
jgi:hypothetical protein